MDSVLRAERTRKCAVHAIDPSRRLFYVKPLLEMTCHAPGALWRPEIKLLDDQNRPSAPDAVEPSVVLPVLLGNLPPRSSARDPCHRAIVALVLDLPCCRACELRPHAKFVRAWVLALGSDK